jgi:hypothetical protein
MKAGSVLCQVGPEGLCIIQIREHVQYTARIPNMYSIQQGYRTVLRLRAINSKNSVRIARNVNAGSLEAM